MKRTLDFISDRLAEPGTHRSIAVILFAVTGAGNSEELWMSAVYLVIAALGAWSALKPEDK